MKNLILLFVEIVISAGFLYVLYHLVMAWKSYREEKKLLNVFVQNYNLYMDLIQTNRGNFYTSENWSIIEDLRKKMNALVEERDQKIADLTVKYHEDGKILKRELDNGLVEVKNQISGKAGFDPFGLAAETHGFGYELESMHLKALTGIENTLKKIHVSLEFNLKIAPISKEIDSKICSLMNQDIKESESFKTMIMNIVASGEDFVLFKRRNKGLFSYSFNINEYWRNEIPSSILAKLNELGFNQEAEDFKQKVRAFLKTPKKNEIITT